MGAISATFPLQISPISRHTPTISNNTRSLSFLPIEIPSRNPKSRRGFAVSAGDDGLSRDDAGAGGGRDDLKRDRRQPAFNLKWRDLLDPDPENLLAIALTGLLSWASVQVLWQLFFISVAILLAALKFVEKALAFGYPLRPQQPSHARSGSRGAKA